MMKLPVETSPFLWGAGTGAVALAIVGFGFGGWATMPGATGEPSRELAAACADALTR